jgi:hypothetical protein
MNVKSKLFVHETGNVQSDVTENSKAAIACNFSDSKIAATCRLMGSPHSNALNGLQVGKIREEIELSDAGTHKVTKNEGSNNRSPRILCGIFTMAENHATKVMV